jgi:preprotein translocase subunit SecG
MILYYGILVLHVIVCAILVLVVLLQSGRGADLAGAFGGGATQTAFGSRGPASFLSKMTTIAAVVFMITCLALALISTKRESKSILEGKTQQTAQPAKKETNAAPIAVPSERTGSSRSGEGKTTAGTGSCSSSGNAECSSGAQSACEVNYSGLFSRK